MSAAESAEETGGNEGEGAQALKTHLVIPCFRESRRLPVFLAELCAAMEAAGGVAVLVVDDGSGADEAAALRAEVERLRAPHDCLLPLLELPENLGKGGAVYAGWARAAAEAHWLGFVDADGSCPAGEVARLIELAREGAGRRAHGAERTAQEAAGRMPAPHLLGQDAQATQAAQVAPALIASRVKMLGRRVERQLKRHLLGRVYATLVSQMLDIPVYDSQCGLKIVPRAAYEAVAGRLTIHGFAFDVDLIVALLDHGTPVVEEPIDWHEVPGGKVRLLRDSWRMARDIWRIRQGRRSF